MTGLVKFVITARLRSAYTGQEYAGSAEIYPNLSRQSVSLVTI